VSFFENGEKVKSNKMLIQKFNRNGVYKLILKLVVISMVGISIASCASYSNTNTISKSEIVISEITTYQTSVSKSDVADYFCSNLTEYFNTYKYYKISSEVYSEKEKQNFDSSSKITKRGYIYNVDYKGSAGQYTISFSNKQFPESEQIFTFGQGTILGNAIRGKVYDTFSAWMNRVKIVLKANGKTYLYGEELKAAVEIENWYNSLI